MPVHFTGQSSEECTTGRLVAIGNFLQDPNLDTFYAELEGRANTTSAPAPAVEAEPEVKEEKKAKKAVLKKKVSKQD